MKTTDDPERNILERELNVFLRQLQNWLELPMIVLAFVWLILFVAEILWGLSPFLQGLGTAIWIAFILDFLLRLLIAPRKIAYVRSNWLTAISLVLPALRLFRVVRIARLLRLLRGTRGLRLVRVVSSLNRGMRALRKTMRRRGAGYVAVLTLIILFVSAAGIYAFEGDLPGDEGIESYGEALWWTAMLLTSVGSEYWPSTVEGRVLCLLIAIYSLGMLGYVTASLASFFLGRDAESASTELADKKTLRDLRRENEALLVEVRRLLDRERT